ncbi:hypothetical protein SPRG_19959 [Saprolegnia parasitica CBS 223.65]|uniref:Uncharacterized protein n=1 Tax=Saprolegnia parasitica (strain CBS 223.65) TaxID=695850 RepID=A0A067CHV6_SAPPC|nr:hypothetical protein SPRG_19959 [Saprolegnia parasitica CBS 223.65]KDO28745.1 hypothetical protein SPRG_19959 [Saprolegnia parasitica CBS 223.65]|eukprot:XP_012200492.1 hypothetical protein SPRG_19959 [Saprolegnia parasitica CBS 223.65]
MLRNQRVTAMLVLLLLLGTDAGRRYAVRDGRIRELSMFADENAWIAHVATHLTVPTAALSTVTEMQRQHVSVDAIWVHQLFKERSIESARVATQRPVHAGYRASVAMLSAHSIFVLGRNGLLFERYFNGVVWVYMRHVGATESVYVKRRASTGDVAYTLSATPHMAPMVAVTRIAHKRFQSILVADATGRLLQRDVSDNRQLRWVDITPPGATVATTGVLSADGRFYIAAADGQVFSWDVASASLPLWHREALDVDDPADAIVTVVGASKTLYVLTALGRLLEFALEHGERQFIDHSAAIRFQIEASLGVVNTATSVFGLSPTLGLVEFNKTTSTWRVHGHPPTGQLLGGLGGNDPSMLLVVASDFSLWQCNALESDSIAKWIHHGGHAVHPVPPIALGTDDILLQLSDGRLGRRWRQHRNEAYETMPVLHDWQWDVYDVPEGAAAPCGYCSNEPDTEDNCVRGTPARLHDA